MGRIHDGQTSVKVRSPPKNIGGYGTVSVWRSAHFYRPDRDRLQSLASPDVSQEYSQLTSSEIVHQQQGTYASILTNLALKKNQLIQHA